MTRPCIFALRASKAAPRSYALALGFKKESMCKKIIVVIVFIITIPSAALAGEDYDQNWIVLSMTTNKDELRLGEEIRIDLTLINFADHEITFHKDPHRIVILRSRLGERCPVSDISQVMEGKLVTLKPKERIDEILIGKLVEGKGYIAKGRLKSEGRYKVEGLFIEFPTYRIFIEPGHGKYSMQATYNTWIWQHKSNIKHIEIKQ